MKYIVIEASRKNNKVEIPIIFPNILVHKEVADSTMAMIMSKHKMDSKVVAAGSINSYNMQCSGFSETLNIGSRFQDTQLIQTYDYNHGII